MRLAKYTSYKLIYKVNDNDDDGNVELVRNSLSRSRVKCIEDRLVN